jgi:SnoaL-like domain
LVAFAAGDRDTGTFIAATACATITWNAHDLDRILSHYVEDLEMSSPLIIERKIDPSGVLRGKAAIREYWAIGLTAVPPIQFELIDVHVGVNSIGILNMENPAAGRLGFSRQSDEQGAQSSRYSQLVRAAFALC